ncbi:unnamed protein product [Miscanthus lutarioriparius]|uniref:Gamma tubulin complex component C-terminal domain-containing protein n=1 Tax=Miscanthus lutarioriparius TaxID=422564 RepID=A0A811QAD2_9POAL|nr:unnamed protein product [Miscanthus lutarioriparius]
MAHTLPVSTTRGPRPSAVYIWPSSNITDLFAAIENFVSQELSYGMKSSTSQKDLKKSNASELPSQGKATSALVLDGWDSIVLEYSVDWPLQLFFTPDVMSKKVS